MSKLLQIPVKKLMVEDVQQIISLCSAEELKYMFNRALQEEDYEMCSCLTLFFKQNNFKMVA
jgi:hypothetical protein